ncbi:GTPase-activating protein CdGAPr isoform X2 [Aphidius gifuensis]|uniref:GTPase-activating protein CdGAPr isoform X2 n=1 Tax=Aphidius gifuensis TaxID=684658 RepID=UPI001CDCC8EB|nr:GTPase-activating protein CdGAPr isoform X2 [Aphidius gifuensis]
MRRVLSGCSSCSDDLEDLGCNRNEEFGTSVGTGSKMGSIARFPKLDECAHFHYEHVELSGLEVTVTEVPNDGGFAVRVTSGDTCWTLQRSYDNFVMFDKQLHRCIFDRKFSSIKKLPDEQSDDSIDLLVSYLDKFTKLNHDGLNCGPVLNWLQLDNRGRRILVPESDSCPINTPAVAAAYAVRPYNAQASDEITFQVGDMISVIDMPPPGESNWWRGKKGFAVGFFPAENVAVIGDKVPRHLKISTTVHSKLPVKPVLRKHGKLIAFFRSFILNRPSRRRLKQSGILKERVFGCDLGEHLLNSGQDVPAVLTCCADFIETHGLVDGIYRLSGVTSNIQRLRNAFDEDRVPALKTDESILQDIHSVASLLKMYFRELPNPLCTYQLYSTFVSAVQASSDSERLRRMRDAVRKLPPPHYRTLEYLMRHLVRVAACGADTGMTPRNVAIVWAPNLLRCKELEIGGVAALQGVGVQAVVTEFLICYAELIFGDHNTIGRPKSLAFTTPARLLSLEEARNRTTLRNDSEYIEVGDGPKGLPTEYHTVIELPLKRTTSSKRSPSLNWRSIFRRPGSSSVRNKHNDNNIRKSIGTPQKIENIPNSINTIRRLRPVKSVESLDGEDIIGPLLLSSLPNRSCGHSRSVSHDSYFDHLADSPQSSSSPLPPPLTQLQSSSSPLDLSEIQLNFDLEEREMRMLSEEDSCEGVGGGSGCGGDANTSVEASPRRARTETPLYLGNLGGSKRKRSRLEERLHCDVELRFIDSQSPDQVMVTADIHEMESIDTPSPLITPGYLPLLSEASTPLSPSTNTLQPTPTLPSISPTNLSRGSRISFRSFTLPLDIGDDKFNINNNNNNETIEIKNNTDDNNDNDDDNNIIKKISTSQNNNSSVKFESINSINNNDDNDKIIDCQQDQEMTQCDVLGVSIIINDNTNEKIDIKNNKIVNYLDEEMSGLSSKNCDDKNNNIINDEKLNEQEQEIINQLSSPTDIDSPMSCEQTDSSFIISNESDDKIYKNSKKLNNTNEWIIIEKNIPKVIIDDTLNNTIDNSISDNNISIESTIDTGSSDFTESPILHQENNSEMTFKIDDIIKNSRNNTDDNIDDNFTIKNSNIRTMELQLNYVLNDDDKNLNNNIIDNDVKNNKNYKISNEIYEKSFNKFTAHLDKFKINNNNDIVNSNVLHNDEENIVIPSENAAEALEIAHDPEGASELTSLNSTYSNESTSIIDDSIVLRDTASILQELALQRLSGGIVVGDTSTITNTLTKNERKIIDKEISNEFIRDNNEKNYDIDTTKLTSQQTNLQYLPPCLRARHARSTRAALSRSLDEGKFNRMTSESTHIQIDKTTDDIKNNNKNSNNNTTTNIGGKLSGSKSAEKLQSKNLGGIDLGDPRCRERIEKYKEERRIFLRDKYRSESFRGSSSKNDDEQALLARLKQRASRSTMH